MIYLLPYVRLRRELLRKLNEWKKVGITATDDFNTYDEGRAQIFCATYASIDSLLLRGKTLTSDFFVFDEIDMVSDDLQGRKTESSISRIIRESKISVLFALSATIGSPELVESWLDCTTFSSDYRPGEGVQKSVKQYPPEKPRFEIIEEIFHLADNAKEPMLIFYYNTKRCRQMAVKLAGLRANLRVKTTKKGILQGIGEIVGKCDLTNVINDQMKCLHYEVAFYHSRLQPQNKEVIEKLFENNLLDVVFTTPALARGINFPVRTVVIPSPFKFSPYLGNVLISRAEIEQMFGRACRPPFQDKGFGILLSADDFRTQILEAKISGTLEKISSKFLQSSSKKGRILNKYRLAVEIIKEAKMQKHSEEQLAKMFESYLFMQEIRDKTGFFKILQRVASQLLGVGLLDKNIDGDIITPDVVDIIIDSGIDDLNRMLSQMNLSKDIVDDKLDIVSGHIFSDILYTLCDSYTSHGVGIVKDKYDPQKISKYIIEKAQEEPPKIDRKHLLFTALDLYSAGMNLEKIEHEYSLEPDSIPYIATNVVSQDLFLLAKLIRQQCMGDRDKLRFCDYLVMYANIVKRGVPYQILPFIELVDRLGRKAALNIWKQYNSIEKLLRVLKDEKRTSKEFIEIPRIGKTFSGKIIEKRKELIMNLQKKHKLWITFSLS